METIGQILSAVALLLVAIACVVNSIAIAKIKNNMDEKDYTIFNMQQEIDRLRGKFLDIEISKMKSIVAEREAKALRKKPKENKQ